MAAGRPSGFTQDIADAMCERLSLGESLRSICRDEAMPSQSMVFRWLVSKPEFREQYAHAREVQADSWADDILEIADDNSNDVIRDPDSGNERFNSEFAARSRLRVDTRKWLMARMAPKKYGDKVTQQITGEDGGPLQVTIQRYAEDSDSKRVEAKAISKAIVGLPGEGR